MRDRFHLCFNTLTANYQYSHSNWVNLPQLIQMQSSKKPKTFCSNFFKFWTFWKQKMNSQLKYFSNYWLRKTWLLKCIKSPVSENPSAFVWVCLTIYFVGLVLKGLYWNKYIHFLITTMNEVWQYERLFF